MIITGFVGISRNRTMMKSDEMKHEMTSFNTMGLKRNVLFQTQLLFVAIYGLMWSSFNIDDTGLFESPLLPHTPLI